MRWNALISFSLISKNDKLFRLSLFFSLIFHRDESSFLIASLFFELIRINREFAHFKEKMISKFSAFEKKLIKIATNVIQLSIVFDELKKAIKVLKNCLLTMKKLIKNERMFVLLSEINSERKMFVFRAKIVDERIVTIENNHENQKSKSL